MLLSRHLPSAPRGCPQRGQIPLKGWLNCTDWRNYWTWRCSGSAKPPFLPPSCPSPVFVGGAVCISLPRAPRPSWCWASWWLGGMRNVLVQHRKLIWRFIAARWCLFSLQRSTCCIWNNFWVCKAHFMKKNTTESDVQPNPSEGTWFAYAVD